MMNTFNQNDFEIIKQETLYQGRFRLVRLHLRHRLFDGTWSTVMKREIFERSSAAAVLPYDPELDRVILIEQFRPGAINSEHSPWQIEIPAGILESNEKPEELAIREAKEETGCTISELKLIYSYFVSPGGSTEFIHIFWAKVSAHNVEGIYGLAEENENIRVLNLTSDEAISLVHNQKVRNASAIVAIQWLELNRDKIKNSRK